jgi:uncharacterized membrane protein (GlpM family)
MSFQEIILRFVAGGILVVAVSALAKSKYPILAGLFVLFPAVTLVSFFFLARTVPSDTIRKITIFSIYTLPTTLAFLITFLQSHDRFGVLAGLAMAMGSWFLVAIVLLWLHLKVFHIS